MSHFITLIKSNLIKQTRRYSFFLIIGIGIFLGFLCVPDTSAGYEIFYLGGVRGVYNSAWLGVLGAILPVLLLWLPGFYLLRSQVTDDKELRIGQMIASAPVSKTRYIYGKLLSNFFILMLLQLLFLVALMAMQLIRQESMRLSMMHYLLPLIYVTVPYLLVLASLTILFDVVPFLKGAFGNTIIFVLWIVLSSVSVASPGSRLDLFGTGVLLNAMMEGARLYFPHLPEAASFGYYPTTIDSPTFAWNGMDWNLSFLLTRFIWIVAALFITQVSVIVFNRFKNLDCFVSDNSNRRFEATPVLSPFQRKRRISLLRMVLGELKIMLSGHSIWWYVSVMAVLVFTPFVTSGEALKWVSLSMLLPMSIWSQMGNREKAYGTSDMIASSCSVYIKWIATWLAGVIVALLMSLGMFTRIIMLSEWNYLMPWIAGMIFLPTLALVLGSVSGNRKLFEALFIALMYFGPVNNMWRFDFMGLTSNNTRVYMVTTLVLLIAGIAAQIVKRNI